MDRDRKVVILTGGASGIGKHLAHVFAARGDRLVATDIQEEALKEEGRKGSWDPAQVAVRKLDIRDRTAWQETIDFAVRTWGKIDLLMNIAGYLLPGYLHEIDPEEIDRHIDINVKGTLYGTQVAARQMVSQGYGHIVNFASLASLVPVPGIALYSASKFSVRGFSLAVGHELRPHGVSVTVVCPDAVRTPMLDLEADYKEAALVFSGSKPLTVEDIERVLFKKVLPKRPLEVFFPPSRGWLAKVANLSTSLATVLEPIFTRKGLANQEKYISSQG